MSVALSELLFSFFLIFFLSMMIIYVLHFYDIPTPVGYLLAGIIIGPAGFSIITDGELIEILAEIGIIFLLFLIGVEFSLKDFIQQSRTITGLGLLQVLPTTLIVLILGLLFQYNVSQSIFFGFLITMSSTAIVLKLLIDRSEMDTIHGKLASGICIFQDLVVVVMVLLLPILGGRTEFSFFNIIFSLAKSFVIIILTFIFAKLIVPQILNRVIRTQLRELFLLTIIMLCFGVAYFTSYMGLSLEIGAFLVGLVISESDYHHYVITEVLPFKDIFTILFFISIGLLLDLDILFDNSVSLLILIPVIIGIKFLVLVSGPIILGYSFRTSMMVALRLSQIGEFSFILAKEGLELAIISETEYQLLLISTIATMIITPFLVINSESIVEKTSKLPYLDKIQSSGSMDESIKSSFEDHVIIVGYGVNGKNLSSTLNSTGIDYVIIDMDPDINREIKENKVPFIFGDATKEHTLKKANIKNAKAIVIATSDPLASPRIIRTVKQLNSGLFIIVRSRYLREVERLLDLGANEVISEEFETSLTLTGILLQQFSISTEDILEHIHNLRHTQDLLHEIFHRSDKND